MAKEGSGDKQRWRTRERFDCSVLCFQKDEWDDAKRSALGCARIDLPPVAWHVDVTRIHSGGHMGRAPAHPSMQPAGIKRWSPQQPTEDPADGCPASWYRSRFIASVMPYLRRRDDNGNRVANLILERCDDDLILQFVAYAEDEQERWESYRAETMSQ